MDRAKSFLPSALLPSLLKYSFRAGFVTGQGFSRADKANKMSGF
jgi:hypothetical protein